MKEVLTIQIGENESSKYWLSVLNELKNRGVRYPDSLCRRTDRDKGGYYNRISAH